MPSVAIVYSELQEAKLLLLCRYVSRDYLREDTEIHFARSTATRKVEHMRLAPTQNQTPDLVNVCRARPLVAHDNRRLG
jgi:hypothetical protein